MKVLTVNVVTVLTVILLLYCLNCSHLKNKSLIQFKHTHYAENETIWCSFQDATLFVKKAEILEKNLVGASYIQVRSTDGKLASTPNPNSPPHTHLSLSNHRADRAFTHRSTNPPQFLSRELWCNMNFDPNNHMHSKSYLYISSIPKKAESTNVSAPQKA